MLRRGTAGALCALAVCVRTAGAQPAELEQHTEEAPKEAPSDDATSLSASLGATLNTGNTRTWQLNAGSDFLLVRTPHAMTAQLALAYGEADLPDDGRAEWEETVGNLRARARYDYFLTRLDAVFAATAFRRDEFAGLDARVQGQLGYLRYVFRGEKHRLWGELGYDATYDDYHPLLIDPVAMTFSADTTQVVHSARAFVGYDNRLTESVTYLGGLEALVNVEDPEDTRVNFDNALRSQLGGNFQLELKFSLQYDNVPVPGARKLDTQSIVSVIYNLI